MQPSKPSFWRSLIERIRRLAGLDMPVTSHFVDQPIVIEYDLGASSALTALAASALTGTAVEPDPAIETAGPAPARRSELLLAPRLASVARLNLPSARRIERKPASGSNRPVKAESDPVKTRQAEAWMLARKSTRQAAPSAKIVQLPTQRRNRPAARAGVSLAA